MVLRSKSRLPVIMPAGSDSSLIKGVYGSAVFAGERDVDASVRCTLPDPEIRLSRLSEAHTRDMVLHDQSVAQRRQSFLVEALAPLNVRYGKTNVIQHHSTPTASGTEATSGRLSIPMTPSSPTANFLELRKAEVQLRSIPLPRTPLSRVRMAASRRAWLDANAG